MRLHDYTKETRGWGHDYTYDPAPGGLTAKMAGWGTGITVGDLICITGPTGKPCPQRVVSIRYETDPPDMWFAEVAYDAETYRSALNKRYRQALAGSLETRACAKKQSWWVRLFGG